MLIITDFCQRFKFYLTPLRFHHRKDGTRKVCRLAEHENNAMLYWFIFPLPLPPFPTPWFMVYIEAILAGCSRIDAKPVNRPHGALLCSNNDPNFNDPLLRPNFVSSTHICYGSGFDAYHAVLLYQIKLLQLPDT